MKKNTNIRAAILILLICIAPSTSFSAEKAREGHWFVKGGLFGAAYTLKGGYLLTRHENINYSFDLGFGTGNNFSLTTIAGTARYNYYPDTDPGRWKPYIGMELNYSDFSRKVVDIVPVTTTIEKGGAFGLGILAGMARSNLFAQLGYDLRTGGFGEIGYEF